MAFGVVLFAQAVLGVEKRRNSLRDIVFAFQMTENVTRYVFEFIGEDVRHVAEFLQGSQVVVFSDYMPVTFSECRSIRIRVKCINGSTLAVSRLCDHETELPTSYYADSFSHLLRFLDSSIRFQP